MNELNSIFCLVVRNTESVLFLLQHESTRLDREGTTRRRTMTPEEEPHGSPADGCRLAAGTCSPHSLRLLPLRHVGGLPVRKTGGRRVALELPMDGSTTGHRSWGRMRAPPELGTRGSIAGVGDGWEHHRSWGREGASPELGMDGSTTGVEDGREHHQSWGWMGAPPELGTEGSNVDARVGESSVAGLDDRGRCRMDLPGPTTSVGTRTDYSVGPWDYPTCAPRHLLA
jgi:hypothetical protein